MKIRKVNKAANNERKVKLFGGGAVRLDPSIGFVDDLAGLPQLCWRA
jgi:hypothetical protein